MRCSSEGFGITSTPEVEVDTIMMSIYGAIVQLSCTHVASVGLVKIVPTPSLVLNSCTTPSIWLFTPSTSVDKLYIPPSTSVDELYNLLALVLMSSSHS